MVYEGTILKMEVELSNPVQYELPINHKSLPINNLIGKYISLEWLKEIICIECGRKINKSFAQGYCFTCFKNTPETSECILRPELCQAHEGISRDMEWSENHCLQDHFVYLAISSGIKVGVTRATQIPTRWIDQGAWQAIKFAQTPNRYLSGLIEVAIKKVISDRTQWQRMLKNELIEGINLLDKKEEMISYIPEELKKYKCSDNTITEIAYPVEEYPKKIKSVSFDKTDELYGILIGIKGQYLIFDNSQVFNVRKHNGYQVKIDF